MTQIILIDPVTGSDHGKVVKVTILGKEWKAGEGNQSGKEFLITDKGKFWRYDTYAHDSPYGYRRVKQQLQRPIYRCEYAGVYSKRMSIGLVISRMETHRVLGAPKSGHFTYTSEVLMADFTHGFAVTENSIYVWGNSVMVQSRPGRVLASHEGCVVADWLELGE